MKTIRCLVVLCLAIGCGDGEPGQGPDPDDPAGGEATCDSRPCDARRAKPAITSVATIGGFTEIRQGYEGWLEGFSDRLVITGSKFRDVESVMVGPLPATIVSATATEVRADVDIPHGFAPGPLTVTVSGAEWSATSPTPITITHVIVGPGAPLDGRGTGQSPIALCGPALTNTRAGDVIDLLAGTHSCSDRIYFYDAGMEIRGAGVGVTVIAPGFLGFDVTANFPDVPPTRLHDLTVQSPATPVIEMWKVLEPPTSLIVERLAVVGGTSGAVSFRDAATDYGGYGGSSPVQIDGLSYEGAGTAIYLEWAHGSIAHTRIQGCETGIHYSRGWTEIVVSETAIEGCATGAVIGELWQPYYDPQPGLDLQSSQIHAVTGVLVRYGTLGLTGGEIAASGGYGIRLLDGDLRLSGGARVTAAGIAVEVLGQPDHYVSLEADGAELIGGQIGLDFSTSEGTRLILRNTLVQGGNLGLTVNTPWWGTIDLGTAASPGNNRLVGGGFAYRHTSELSFTPHSAVGTTLNGRSYAGQLLAGPAALAPDYDLPTETLTQF